MPVNKRKFSVSNDKKVLHKVRKHWVVVSLAMLTALGTGSVTATTHADVQPNANQSHPSDQTQAKVQQRQQSATLVKADSLQARSQNQINDTKVDNKSLMQQADVLHNHIMANMLTTHHNEPNVNANVHTPKQSTSQPINKPIQMKNRAIRLGGIHEELSQEPDGPQSQASDNHWIYDNQNNKYLSDGQITDWSSINTYNGLKYKYSNSLSAIEFVGGTTNPDLSGFLSKGVTLGDTGLSDYSSIKFDSNINSSHLINMNNMLSLGSNLTSVSIDMNTSNVKTMQGLFTSDNALQSIILSNNFTTNNVTTMSDMFSYEDNLKSLVLPRNFTTNNIRNMHYMFGSSSDLNTLIINSNDTKFNNNISLKGTWYKLTTSNNTIPSTESSTNLMDGQPHVGTWVLRDTDHVKYSDIYHSVDGMTTPTPSQSSIIGAADHTYTSDVPASWAVVDNNGDVVQPDKDTFTFNNSNHTVNIAPVYDGMTYKYNKANNTVEFVSGTPNSNLSNFVSGANSDIKNAKSITFDNGINFNGVTSMDNMFGSDSNLATLALPSSFSTSNVTDMGKMFNSDSALKSLTLPSSFDTTKAKNSMANMFGNSALTSLTISSPNTKLYTSSGLPDMYAKTGNTHSSTKNDFSKGNVGTFVIGAVEETDTIDYTYNDSKLASDKLSPAPKGKSFDINSIPTTLSALDNYYLENSNNRFTHDGTTHDVAVLPNQVSDTINYQYNNRTIASHKFQGNDVNAQGANNTSFDVDSRNEPDIPSGYQLVNTNNDFNYDGKTHNVAIKPIQDTDTINYQYKGNTIASYQPIGNDTSDITISSINHPNMPDHYNLVNATNQFKYDGDSHSVAITPDQKTDTIDYQLDGTTEASDTFTGNDYQAQDASDTTVTIDSSNDSKLPSGYHLVDSSNTFRYDGGTHDVAIAPSTASTSVEYVNQVTGSDAGSYSDKIDDGTNLTISTTAPQSLDTSKYHLARSQAPSFRSGTTNNTVYVLPNTATVEYMSGSTQEGSDQTVRPSSAPMAGDNSFTIDSNNLPKVPANYRVTSSNSLTFNYGNTNTVSVAPDQVTLKFIFYNARDGHNVKVGSDAPMTHNAGTSINTNLLSLPNGYHLAGGVPATITFNKTGYQKISVVANDNNPINQPNDADDIPVEGNQVDFKGHIVLKFPDNANTESITIPYSIETTVDSKISDILKSGTPSVVIPSDYVGKVIQQFNTANFTYNGQTSSSEYDGVYVKPVYGTNGQPNVTNDGNNKYTYQNPNVTFSFNANSMNEDIYYKYGDYDENDDDTPEVMSGANDTTGDVTSAVASSTGASGDLKPGWQLASANNDFTYGNGGNDSTSRYSDNYDVSVTPQSASTVVQYKVSDAKATNNGSTLASYSASGNEYQATDAGNNDLTISQSSGVDNIPKGYSIISGQHTTFPYNNGQNNTVKIIGNMHNNGGKDLTPSTTKPTTPSDQSDIVTVNENEYNGSTKVGTITQYVAESGRTGESFTVNPDDFMPNDYQTDSADRSQTGTFAANGISGIPNNTVNFKYDAEQGSDINVTYINQNDATVGNGSISGNYGTTGNVQTTVSGKIPGGYDYENATENNEPVTTYQITKSPQNIIVHVSGKQVKGIVPLRLIYKESNGTVDSDISNDYMPFTSRVGDTVAVNPVNYERINYDDENQVQTFPMDWNSVKNDLNNYKTPIVTFNYVGPTGSVDVTYVDVSAGAQPDPSEGNKMVTYQGHQDPVVGTQNLSNMGVVGSTVNLAAKDSNVSGAKDVLAVPDGFHLVNNSNQVLVPNVTLTNTPVHLTLYLAASGKVPSPQPKPAVKPAPKPAPAPSDAQPVPSDNYVPTPTPAPAPVSTPAPQRHRTAPVHVVAKMTPPTHFRWFYVIKACLAHRDLKSVGKVADYDAVLRPGHQITAHIRKIFKLRYRNKTFYRYEIRAKFDKHFRTYYVTGNGRFTRNAYVQPHELRHVHGMLGHYYYKARLIHDCYLYSKPRYNNKTRIKTLRRGKTLHVKRVISIGRKGDYQTRFELTNGKYVTANKNWVKLI